MTASPLHSVSVAGVTVSQEGQVLVIRRRDNGQWQAPGGVLELSETFEAGVVREIEEETGVRVEVERLTGIYKNMSKGVVALVFRCRPLDKSSDPVPTAESVDAAWLAVDEALTLMTPAFAARVADALDISMKPKVRAHDGVNLL